MIPLLNHELSSRQRLWAALLSIVFGIAVLIYNFKTDRHIAWWVAGAIALFIGLGDLWMQIRKPSLAPAKSG
jgi:hypothetical protein